MLRTVIDIDDKLCDGCGQCVTGCAEGALAIVDGKARLVSDKYCDGLGACLGHCPQGAIRTLQREADDFDEAAVQVRLKELGRPPAPPVHAAPAAPAAPAHHHEHHHGGHVCPGSMARALKPPVVSLHSNNGQPAPARASQLGQWPVQLRLISPQAPFLNNAHLLVCADCVPFAVPDFHERYLSGKVVVVGCPKLDDKQAMIERLAAIIALGGVRAVTVLRMSVPCCGGIAAAAEMAVQQFNPDVPLTMITIGTDGREV